MHGPSPLCKNCVLHLATPVRCRRLLCGHDHRGLLKCLPTRGGVRVSEFIATWHVSVNQMEAAGFLPSTRQLLTIFTDGLPNNTVAFVNLYDDILSSLNEPNEQLLPSIHHLFDCTTHIDNNIQRNCILHPSSHCLPPNNYPSISYCPSQTTSCHATDWFFCTRKHQHHSSLLELWPTRSYRSHVFPTWRCYGG